MFSSLHSLARGARERRSPPVDDVARFPWSHTRGRTGRCSARFPTRTATRSLTALDTRASVRRGRRFLQALLGPAFHAPGFPSGGDARRDGVEGPAPWPPRSLLKPRRL